MPRQPLPRASLLPLLFAILALAFCLCAASLTFPTQAFGQQYTVDRGQNFAPSAKTAITGTFAATGQSASFTPIAGREFNVTLRGTFVATVQLERSFDAGANWSPITAAGTQLYLWTAPASETAEEPQYGVLYRLNDTAYTSGTVTYRISQ